jgi:hypothetical protein
MFFAERLVDMCGDAIALGEIQNLPFPPLDDEGFFKKLK